jgi:hypothetical protein
MTRVGPIKCGDVERRRLLEELCREDCVEFIGEAAEVGRQADAGDHLGDSSDGVENADPYAEASADE